MPAVDVIHKLPAWTDRFGRVARKLRVSVTDRCNLRCIYCMPEKPVWLPKAELLSYEELVRLVGISVRSGIHSVRITGGEPLLRKDLDRFIRMLKAIGGLEDLALTTNGIYMPEQAPALRAAGLDRVTVSLDSLDPERFKRLARRNGFKETLDGILAAKRAGFRDLKVNVVVMRGINDDEIGELAAWAREEGLMLRFIEFMPLEGDHIWNRNLLVSAKEILERVSGRFPVRAKRATPAQSTAEVYDYADGKGAFGIIASVTRAFCADCDRVRMTADGGFRTCLFATTATDLRGPLRAGSSDGQLAEIMRGAVEEKAAGHLINLPEFKRPDRAMHAIGG